MSAAITFPKGSFYTTHDDAEQLDHEAPEAAIEAAIDSASDPSPAVTTERVISVIKACTPLTVYAWERVVPPKAFTDHWADDLVERLQEQWGEEHDPEGDRGLSKEAEPIMREAVAKIIALSPSWTCQVVGKVDLDAAQVEAILRDWSPEWFEEDEDDGADHAGA